MTNPALHSTDSVTVADLVTANPAAARIFERHEIDFCCHGQRPLDEACTEAGVDPDEVRSELAALAERSPEAAVPAVAGEDVATLIGHIVTTHHRYLRRELPRLHELMTKVVSAHGTNHPEVHDLAATLAAITADLLPHLVKEERVLFPLVIELLGAVEPTDFHCGSVLNPVTVMEREHDDVGELLSTMRRQTDAYTPPADACPTWRALLAGLEELETDVHLHVHLENNVLFPKILELEADLQRGDLQRV
jgi:regulator of cell morphogenesis and NO signaling